MACLASSSTWPARNLFNLSAWLIVLLCCGSIFFAIDHHGKIRRFESRIDSLKIAIKKFENLQDHRVKRELQQMPELSLSIAKRDAEPAEADYLVLDGGGSSYIHWGRSDCPENTLSELVYSGYAAGTHYSHAGGGAGYICLDSNITYEEGKFKDGGQGSSHLYGVEFRDSGWVYPLFNLSDTENNALLYHSMPCAVCLAQSMVTQIMIPDREVCPGGWNMEYRGFIMSESHGSTHTSKFICVDEKPQVVPGTNKNDKGSFLYMVETQCGSLICEPFVGLRELRCVVCSY